MTNRLATSVALHYCQTRRRCSGAPAAPPKRSRTATSRRGTDMIGNCLSGHIGHRMRGSPLQRSLCDGLLLVLCI